MTISSPEDRKKIFAAIREISNLMVRIEAERDLIKDIVKDVSDNFLISKKIINKMAKVYHNQTLTQEIDQHEEFVETYEDVTSANKSQNTAQPAP